MIKSGSQHSGAHQHSSPSMGGSRVEYYQERAPCPMEVTYGELSAESPDISQIKNAADKEFYDKKRIAAGRGSNNADEEKIAAANFVYDAIKKKNPEFVSQLFERVISQVDIRKKQVIHLPIQVKKVLYEQKVAEAFFDQRPAKATELDVNTLAMITSLRLAEDLQAMAEKQGLKNLKFANDRMLTKESISTDKRGDSDIIGRFVLQPKYDMSQFTKNDLVVIADDSVQAGAVTATIVTALADKGCKVLGVAALSCMPETKKLQADPEIRDGLGTALKFCFEAGHAGKPYNEADAEQYRKELGAALSQVGLSVESLTNREALMIMALLLDKDNKVHRQFFEQMKRTAGVDPRIVEGNDALLISDTMMTPREFGDKIAERIHQVVRQGEAMQKKSAALS